MSDVNKSQNVDLLEDKYIEFSLGKQDFAMSLLMVREVISVPETTPVPNSPPHFLGLMNLRGQVITIVDLRKKLKITPKEKVEENAVIIVSLGDYTIGMIVDSVNKVFTSKVEDLSQVPEISSQINAQYIKGVFRKDKKLSVLIDIVAVLDLTDKNLIKQSKAA